MSIIFGTDVLKKSSGLSSKLKPVEVAIDKRKEEVLEISVKPGGLPQRIIIASKQLSRFAKWNYFVPAQIPQCKSIKA